MNGLVFQYKAINAEGRIRKGALSALNRAEAYRKIVASGLRPVHLAAARGRGGILGRKSRVSIKDLSHLTYQLSVLIDARVPIADSLRSIAEQESNDRLRAVISEIAGRIESGESITGAFTPHRDIFGNVYIATLRSAEVSGNLSPVLAHLADMLDQQYEMGKNIKGALMYPLCVVGALSLAVSFLVVFVVPKFARMFEARGIDLPLLTKVMLLVGQGVQSYWYIILIALGIAGMFLRRLWQREETRWRVDGWLHRVPHLKALLIGTAVGRFSHVFGLSLRSGLSLIDALDLAGASSGRPLLRKDAERMRRQVNQGGRLTDVLQTCEYFPGFARRMVIAGEEAGELPRMCQIVARHYDREVAHLARNIATVIEPIMIVGLAGIVLIVALAIFLPMWNMAVVIG